MTVTIWHNPKCATSRKVRGCQTEASRHRHQLAGQTAHRRRLRDRHYLAPPSYANAAPPIVRVQNRVSLDFSNARAGA
jgi:hypothetical protein